MIMNIRKIFLIFALILSCCATQSIAYAGELPTTTNLSMISSNNISEEIQGISNPDSPVITALSKDGESVIASARKAAPGTEDAVKLAQYSARSTGCSTGCSNGCSTGCSTGCSYGCR